MNRFMTRSKWLLSTTVVVAQALSFCACAAYAGPGGNLKVKLLAINDFHGQLSPKAVSGRPAGGAAVLASYLANAQSGMEDRTIIIGDGDLVGASPANSALLQDEPTIQFLNSLANPFCRDKMNPRCNVVATVGNHEFDEGVTELKRMLNGGNHATGPFIETPFSGAQFPYVCANVIDKNSGNTLLPPYVIKTVRGVPIAFIGAVLKDTPSIVAPAGVAGLTFLDEASAINSYIPEIKAKKVHAIVAVIHQGGTDVDSIVAKLDGEVDVVISGHSHTQAKKLVKNAAAKDVLVTQAYSAGTAYADIELEISPSTKDIVSKKATIQTTWGDVAPGTTPDTTIANLVATADSMVAPMVNQVIGETAASITRTQNAAGESALGDLIADAQRQYEGTDFAFMNPGGIRADLDKGPVTWGELFTIQPFGNQMVRMTMTGQQIYDVLAQQWSTPASPKMLQISGLSYSWTYNGAGLAGTVTEVRKDGVVIDKNGTYTVTINNFLAGGGDNFTVFKNGLDQVVDAVDMDVLVSYIQSLPVPFDGLIEGRIDRDETVPTQFVFTSDAHYGITRSALDGSGAKVTAQVVNQVLVSAMNTLPTVTLPCDDAGVQACEPVGAVDFIAENGDIANRMEAASNIQSAATSWAQFESDYINGLTLKNRNNSTAPIFIVPGNHDATNAVGFYKTMNPLTDATSMVQIYNRMMNPATARTVATYNYETDKIYYSKDIGGVHFVYINMWPDSVARAWMDEDLRKVSQTTPVCLFAHDQPDIETKHLMNPNGDHSINATDKFENLVYGENNGYASVSTIDDPSTIEQVALTEWLKKHKNIVAYFHGNDHINGAYTYAGPNSDISLNVFRVDSPMKGSVSKTDPSQLAFKVISIDPSAENMTVRDYMWNTNTWGASTTVSLSPRTN